MKKYIKIGDVNIPVKIIEMYEKDFKSLSKYRRRVLLEMIVDKHADLAKTNRNINYSLPSFRWSYDYNEDLAREWKNRFVFHPLVNMGDFR